MAGVGVFVADGLRTVLDRRGMMLTVLCQRSSVARGTVYAALAGKPVQLAILVRMARALEVPLSEVSSEAADALQAVA